MAGHSAVAHKVLAESWGVLDLPPRNESLADIVDRRILPRVGAPFEVRHQPDDTWVGLDLSFGGLKCMAPEPYWPGSQFTASLQLDTTTELHMEIQVVELVAIDHALAMRMRFVEPSLPNRHAIARWMTERASRSATNAP